MTKWTVLKPSRWLWPPPSQPNRQTIAAMCRARRIAPPATTTPPKRMWPNLHQLGSVIAEFPTTLAAAQASRQHGMHVLMGAPNTVRGGSHSGNVAAHQLASHGLLDILSSDYYPASLLDAAFRIADAEDSRLHPATGDPSGRQHPQALGLDDRGVIAEGETRRPGAGAPSREHIQTTMSGARERGSFNARKTDLAGGPSGSR